LQLLVFFLLSAALSWTVWLWPVDDRERFLLFVFGFEFKIPLFTMKLLIGNCLPGLLAVIWAFCEGKDQFRRMLSTLTKWRTPLQWYVIAVALPWAVFLATLVAVSFYFPTDRRVPTAIGFFSILLMTLPFGPLWEELAWRAFPLRKLESRYSRLVSALLLGLYWGVWHIPMWLVLGSIPINKVTFFSIGIIHVTAWSVMFAYLYHCSSESLPVLILLHATYAAANIQMLALAPDLHPQLIYVSAILSVCLAVPFAKALQGMTIS
jgi:CAAX protease family protein